MTGSYTSETGFYVLLDVDGLVMSKADVPSGEHPVSDRVDMARTFDVDTGTDLAAHLEDSPANDSQTLPDPAHENASEALNSVSVDDKYRADK